MYNTMGTAVKLWSMCIQPQGSGIYIQCAVMPSGLHIQPSTRCRRVLGPFRGAGAHADGVNLQEIVGAELPGTIDEAASLAL